MKFCVILLYLKYTEDLEHVRFQMLYSVVLNDTGASDAAKKSMSAMYDYYDKAVQYMGTQAN